MKPDTLALDFQSSRTTDIDGRMHVENCRISAARINGYYGQEIPGYEALGLQPDKMYYMLRDKDELRKAAESFGHVPLMMGHIAVSADNPQQDRVVGTVGIDSRFEDPFLIATITIWVQDAIDAVKDKSCAEISCSYRYRPDMTPGSLNGLLYDGVMRDLIANHVALVPLGRAGSDVMVADSLPIYLEPLKMNKRIASIKKFLLPNTDLVALDAAFEQADKEDKDEKTAADKKAKDESEAEEKKAAEDKAAKDAAEKEEADKAASDKAAKDAAEKEEADKAAADKAAKDEEEDDTAMDAAAVKALVASTRQLARDEAIKEINDLTAARANVKHILGDVIVGDSAVAVYKSALKTLGSAYAGSDLDAMIAIVEPTKPRSSAASLASDSAAAKPTFDLSAFKRM